MSTYLEAVNDLWLDLGLEGSGISSVENQSAMKEKVCYWVKRADLEVQNKWSNWDFMHDTFTVNTIAGSREITGPDDLGVWEKESAFIDEVPLFFVGYDEWRSSYKYDTTQGVPWGFTVSQAKKIILIPYPADIYEIEIDYYKAAQSLVANTDALHVPVRFERAVLSRATMYYAAHISADDLMVTARQEYYEVMQKMEAAYLPGMAGYTDADAGLSVEFE